MKMKKAPVKNYGMDTHIFSLLKRQDNMASFMVLF